MSGRPTGYRTPQSGYRVSDALRAIGYRVMGIGRPRGYRVSARGDLSRRL